MSTDNTTQQLNIYTLFRKKRPRHCRDAKGRNATVGYDVRSIKLDREHLNNQGRNLGSRLIDFFPGGFY